MMVMERQVIVSSFHEVGIILSETSSVTRNPAHLLLFELCLLIDGVVSQSAANEIEVDVLGLFEQKMFFLEVRNEYLT